MTYRCDPKDPNDQDDPNDRYDRYDQDDQDDGELYWTLNSKMINDWTSYIICD